MRALYNPLNCLGKLHLPNDSCVCPLSINGNVWDSSQRGTEKNVCPELSAMMLECCGWLASRFNGLPGIWSHIKVITHFSLPLEIINTDWSLKAFESYCISTAINPIKEQNVYLGCPKANKIIKTYYLVACCNKTSGGRTECFIKNIKSSMQFSVPVLYDHGCHWFKYFGMVFGRYFVLLNIDQISELALT